MTKTFKGLTSFSIQTTLRENRTSLSKNHILFETQLWTTLVPQLFYGQTTSYPQKSSQCYTLGIPLNSSKIRIKQSELLFQNYGCKITFVKAYNLGKITNSTFMTASSAGIPSGVVLSQDPSLVDNDKKSSFLVARVFWTWAIYPEPRIDTPANPKSSEWSMGTGHPPVPLFTSRSVTSTFLVKKYHCEQMNDLPMTMPFQTKHANVP